MVNGHINNQRRPSSTLQAFVADFFLKRKGNKAETLKWIPLKGDGSDRTFYRVTFEEVSIVALEYPQLKIDHVARMEAMSFYYIGNHLRGKGIPVPEIYGSAPNEGLFILEDLGDITLQEKVQNLNAAKGLALYEKAIGVLADLQIRGADGFDPNMCYQSGRYDKDIMLQRESNYFLREFVINMLGLSVDEERLWKEFKWLADEASGAPGEWFLHRDFQSRNLMLKDDHIRVIDFQGGRLGPLQYDLASLLNDPYVELDEWTKDVLLDLYLNEIRGRIKLERSSFLRSYDFIALHRNLQVLGAFAFLRKKKGRRYFEEFIPPAVRSLSALISKHPEWPCPTLRSLVEEISTGIKNRDPEFRNQVLR